MKVRSCYIYILLYTSKYKFLKISLNVAIVGKNISNKPEVGMVEWTSLQSNHNINGIMFCCNSYMRQTVALRVKDCSVSYKVRIFIKDNFNC